MLHNIGLKILILASSIYLIGVWCPTTWEPPDLLLNKNPKKDIADEDDEERGEDPIDVDDATRFDSISVVTVKDFTFACDYVPTKVTKAEAGHGKFESSRAYDEEGKDPDEEAGTEGEFGSEEDLP